jgi:hypothetical protein
MSLERTEAKGRTGKPFTIYLSNQQFEQLQLVAKKRCVAKSVLVRFALDRFIDQLQNGQIELPLGLSE